jgi:hypothetical protein
MTDKPIDPSLSCAALASHPLPPERAAIYKKFLAERASRAERLSHVGEVGYCKSCGRPDPNPGHPSRTMLCRRRTCKACRAAAYAAFEASIMAHAPFWPEAA